MAGLVELRALEARKRALVAESEAYRQALMADVQNLRLYALGLQKRLRFFRKLEPVLALVPLLNSLLSSRLETPARLAQPTPWRRVLRWSLLGWRVSRHVAPVARALLGRFRERPRRSPQTAEPENLTPDPGSKTP
jgi:hypothetical protein